MITRQLNNIILYISVIAFKILNCNSFSDTHGEVPSSIQSLKETSVAFAPNSGIVTQDYQRHQQPTLITSSSNHVHQPTELFPILLQQDVEMLDRSATKDLTNVATIMIRDDARRLEQFFRNYTNYGDGEQSDDHSPLNLASLNNRSLSNHRYKHSKQNITSLEAPTGTYIAQSQSTISHKQPLTISHMSTHRSANRQDDARMLLKKGKNDDILINNNLSKNRLLNHQPQLKKGLLIDGSGSGLPPGCIAKSAPYASRCEDHLIRRLSQDATEGRTVIDVTRRVCCALFWHKDCIRSIVVEICPDSSPPAADILLGSRNLDLTLSCQRFNRDGCNGGPRRLIMPSSIWRIITIIVIFNLELWIIKLSSSTI